MTFLTTTPVVGPESEASLSPWAQMRGRFFRQRLARAALCLLGVMYLAAAFAEVAAPFPSQWRNLGAAYCPPQLPRFSWNEGWHVRVMRQHVDPLTLQKIYEEDRAHPVALGLLVRGQPYRLWGVLPGDRHLFGPKSAGESFYFLGADKYGQDVFSRLLYGARISLSIGLAAIAVTSLLGIVIGAVSGYVGGAIDQFFQRAIDVLSGFPQVPLWLAFGAVLPPSWSSLQVYFAITLVLSLLAWTGLARVVRGRILALREEDYATAARLLGASPARVLFRHLLPGVGSHLIVVLALSVPAMILGETSLSFLGLGLRAPIVSWGVMLQDCLSLQTVSRYPWLLMPVVFVVLTVLCFNFVGEGLREAADPHGPL